MTTTIRTTEVAVVDPAFSDTERYALAAFLAGYRGLTREAYALDLRQFMAWCQEQDLPLFGVRRAGIECFARDLEARRAPTRSTPDALTRRSETSTANCCIRPFRSAPPAGRPPKTTEGKL